MKRQIIYFLLFFTSAAFSQEVTKEMGMKSVAEITESTLKPLIKQLYEAKSNEQRALINEKLIDTFEKAITIPNTFDYDFEPLQKDIGILRSPDNMFRIIHWNIVKDDGTFEYYGFIQSKHYDIKKAGFFHKKKTEVIQLYPLIDKSSEIKNPENAVTDNKKWFGMLYNKIIHTKVKSKDYYTLLGWDGNDKFSQKKIIDVLTFDNLGAPHFGADIFNFDRKYPKRIIFEYSATCSMSLRYSNKKDSIVYGHLAPIQSKLEGQYQYYCSDLSFDGFGFKKGKWNYKADVSALNEKDDKDKLYGDPHDISPTSTESTPFPKKKKRKKK